jgi:hypothetical protein
MYANRHPDGGVTLNKESFCDGFDIRKPIPFTGYETADELRSALQGWVTRLADTEDRHTSDMKFMKIILIGSIILNFVFLGLIL